MDRPGLWVVAYSLGVVLVFLLFLGVTADPEAPREARAAGARAADVLGEAAHDAWTAASGTLEGWREPQEP